MPMKKGGGKTKEIGGRALILGHRGGGSGANAELNDRPL